MKNNERYFKVIDKAHYIETGEDGKAYPMSLNKSGRDGAVLLVINGEDTFFELKHLEEIFQTEATVKRVFESGASRNSDQGKLDFEGFLCPLVLKRYAEYMHKCRKMEDGTLRASDNWQNGIPRTEYMKSLYRHFFDTWSTHRGYVTKEDQFENLCGLIFNSMGYLHELLKEEQQQHD